MNEIKLTIEIPGLLEAINNMTAAIVGAPTLAPNPPPEMAALAQAIAEPANIPAPINPIVSGANVATAPAAPSTPPQIPAAPPAPVTPPTNPAMTIPTAAPKEYTIEDFQLACAPLMDAGKRQDIVNLIASLGASSLMDLPKERYNDFAAGLRALGGKL